MRSIDAKATRKQVEEILSNEISGEYSWLDFKLEFKNNPEELVHDILCLSNTRHSGVRLIIYGVEDSSWELKGISNDLISNDIYSIVNSLVWNNKPIILVDHVHVNGKKFGFIAIADTPTKPHYLRKPYKGVPSGAVYIRQGDTNTPFKKGSEIRSIEDAELELMFRERFGLDKPLLEKIEILLTQTDKWEEFRDGELNGYFHQDFPEYQIRFFDRDRPDEESWEDWVELHHKQVDLIQKASIYSRVRRISNLFDWGKIFSIYIHSTPVYQDAALIRLYKVYCPYPSLLESADGRYHIRTNESDFIGHRITYYVGAILCLKNRDWVYHTDNEPRGKEVFRIYNTAMRYHIGESRAEREKHPILVLDIDTV